MLVGDESPSGGGAQLNGRSLTHDRVKFMADIGYCPQFDAIIEQLTGREMLQLFCRLRGIQKEDIPDEIQKWLDFLGK